MEIVLASRNKKKIAELEALLSTLCTSEIKVLSLDDIGYSGDIEEDGASFEENAVIKASVPAALGYIGVADDSGLAVDALGGAPGIFSARYAGSHGDDKANNDKLIFKLDSVPEGERGGAFVCAVACVVPGGCRYKMPEELRSVAASEYAAQKGAAGSAAFTVHGECRGEILRAPDGEGGFGYDPLFYVPEEKTTFARLAPERKNEISHRGRAMRILAQYLDRFGE